MRTAPPEPGCVLYGFAAIGKFIGVPERIARGLSERGHLPCFKLGGITCANKGTLLNWIAEAERKASDQQYEAA